MVPRHPGDSHNDSRRRPNERRADESRPLDEDFRATGGPAHDSHVTGGHATADMRADAGSSSREWWAGDAPHQQHQQAGSHDVGAPYDPRSALPTPSSITFLLGLAASYMALSGGCLRPLTAGIFAIVLGWLALSQGRRVQHAIANGKLRPGGWVGFGRFLARFAMVLVIFKALVGIGFNPVPAGCDFEQFGFDHDDTTEPFRGFEPQPEPSFDEDAEPEEESF